MKPTNALQHAQLPTGTWTLSPSRYTPKAVCPVVPGVRARNSVPSNVIHAFSIPAEPSQRLSVEYDGARLREEALRALTRYQHAGLSQAMRSRDHLFFWTVGGGKSLASLVWGLSERDKKLVYLTRASARLQMLSEIRKWTNAKVQVLEGTTPEVAQRAVPVSREVWQRVRVPSKTRPGKTVWGRERVTVDAHHTRLEPYVVEGDVLDPTVDIYLCTYEVLWAWVPYLMELPSSAYNVVFDELHRLKGWKREAPGNDGTGWRVGRATLLESGHGRPPRVTWENDPTQVPNLGWAAKQVSLRAARRLGVTGTPVRDRPRDLWAELDLVDPGGWGSNWDFVHRYAAAHESQWGGLDTRGSSNEDELRRRIDTLCHRVTVQEVHAQLPPKRRSVIRIPEPELLAFDDLPDAVRELTRDARLSKHIATQLGVAGARKRAAIASYVAGLFEDKTPRKVIVFTYLRADCEALADAIRHGCQSATVWGAHGGTPPDRRAAIRDEYMAHAGPCVLVGTGDSYGEAVNLQDTDVLILAGLPFTPGQLTQWEGRVSRVGQTRPVEVVYVVAEGTADEHVATLLLDKLPPFETLSGLGAGGDAASALEDALGFGDQAATDALVAMLRGGE